MRYAAAMIRPRFSILTDMTARVLPRLAMPSRYAASCLAALSLALAGECRGQAGQSADVTSIEGRLVFSSPAQAAPPVQSLDPVVVTATRSAQSSFNLPVSIDRIDKRVIERENAMINLSESLLRVPGVVVQNRQNYAQDLQISVRGFGARSTFGVRGVRLYVDGIPATMPDGQGQTSNFDLASAGSIEILRGPFSALYGNSSGGVIAMQTEEGGPGRQVASYARLGSYDTSNIGIKASGQQGMVNYVAGLSRFATDGYREHSEAVRNIANAKLRIVPDVDAALTFIGNAVTMPHVQDPLGLSRSQWQSNPRGADANALLFNTRKSVRQEQLGLHHEKILNGEDTLRAMVYAGRRSTMQFQAIPVAAQSAATSAGGVIDLVRDYGGADVRWARRQKLDRGTLQWTAGISLDGVWEARRGYENFSGGMLGVQGKMRRDERNQARNIDTYLQAQWQPTDKWIVLAGVRNSVVQLRSDDRYIAPGNGDDSGSRQYRAAAPVLGATYKLSAAMNLYAAYGKGFETPTLNELSYRLGGSGFNFALQPAKSNHYEAGIKAYLGAHLRSELAVFHSGTRNELSVLSNTGGRAVFQNAAKTRRDGIEWSVQGNWPSGVSMLLSASLLRAVYADAFCPASCTFATQVMAGNRIPGVPGRSAYAELSWSRAASGFSAALEGRYAGRVYVDDLNTDAAPAYFTASLRAGVEQQLGSWRLRGFARIDNLADRDYAGSVIVNESNRRFFEPAPGRNYLIGIDAAYVW